jgi:hypothetical protein
MTTASANEPPGDPWESSDSGAGVIALAILVGVLAPTLVFARAFYGFLQYFLPREVRDAAR